MRAANSSRRASLPTWEPPVCGRWTCPSAFVAEADSISRFLRRELGREVRLREQRASTKSVVAWELVRQAATLTEDATALLNASRDPGAAVRLLLRADSLLARAERLDGHWIEPPIARGWVAQQLAALSSSNEQVMWLTRGV